MHAHEALIKLFGTSALTPLTNCTATTEQEPQVAKEHDVHFIFGSLFLQ